MKSRKISSCRLCAAIFVLFLFSCSRATNPTLPCVPSGLDGDFAPEYFSIAADPRFNEFTIGSNIVLTIENTSQYLLQIPAEAIIFIVDSKTCLRIEDLVNREFARNVEINPEGSAGSVHVDVVLPYVNNEENETTVTIFYSVFVVEEDGGLRRAFNFITVALERSAEIPTAAGTMGIATPRPSPTALQQPFDLERAIGNCRLPCLWGISPGGSFREDLSNLANSIMAYEDPILGVLIGDSDKFGDFYFVNQSLPLKFSLRYSFIYGGFDEVEFLSLVSYAVFSETGDIHYDYEPEDNLMANFQPRQILLEYGDPLDVYFFVFSQNSDVPEAPSDTFTTIFDYSRQGFWIQYQSEVEFLDDLRVRSCPSKSLIEIISWNPRSNYTAESVLEHTWTMWGPRPSDVGDFVPLLEATGMTVAQFSDLLIREPDTCVTLEWEGRFE